jgi:DNA-binding winged helix-turn-helix (wHTH) protein
MSLFRIPVRVIATDPAEYQAFADVLGGQAGALVLADGQEDPAVTLVCPSGQPLQDAGPVVILGQGGLPVPAVLGDVLGALEAAAQAGRNIGAPRRHEGWSLEPGQLTLRGPDGVAIVLTDTESRLLACLMDAQGAVVARDTLLARVWGYRPGLDTHTVETHIYRLRQKIEADPAMPRILLTSGEGYCFAPRMETAPGMA